MKNPEEPKEEDEGRIEAGLCHVAKSGQANEASWTAMLGYFAAVAERTMRMNGGTSAPDAAREMAMEFLLDPETMSFLRELLAARAALLRPARNRFIGWIHEQRRASLHTEQFPSSYDPASGEESLIVHDLSPAEAERRQRRREALAERLDPVRAWLEIEGGPVHWLIFKTLERAWAAGSDFRETFAHMIYALATRPTVKNGRAEDEPWDPLFPSVREIHSAQAALLLLDTAEWRQKDVAAVLRVSPDRAAKLAMKARRSRERSESARKEVEAAAGEGFRDWAEHELRLYRETVLNPMERLLRASIDPGDEPESPKLATGDCRSDVFSQEGGPSPGGPKNGLKKPKKRLDSRKRRKRE